MASGVLGGSRVGFSGVVRVPLRVPVKGSIGSYKWGSFQGSIGFFRFRV